MSAQWFSTFKKRDYLEEFIEPIPKLLFNEEIDN